MPCEYGPAAAGALSVAINSCALTVVEILCFFIWCFLAADSAHKLRAVMDDDWYACMMSRVDNKKWRIGHVCVFVVLGAQMSRMCDESTTRSKKEERTTSTRDERDNNARTQTKTNGTTHFRAFLPSRGRQSAMILVIFVSALHTHTAEREERSETKHRLEKSRQIKFLRKKKK